MPPQDFMTKKEARLALKVKRDEAAVGGMNNILIFKNSHTSNILGTFSSEVNSRPVKKQEGGKRNMKKKTAVIMIEDFSSTNRNDWRGQLQAGCQIWVNHSTGEVSNICPWNLVDENEDEEPVNQNLSGTGSIVYDGEEFGEFMNNLDRLAETPSQTKKV
jgi:hypothetical protein